MTVPDLMIKMATTATAIPQLLLLLLLRRMSRVNISAWLNVSAIQSEGGRCPSLPFTPTGGTRNVQQMIVSGLEHSQKK